MSTYSKHSVVVRDGKVYVRAEYTGYTDPEIQVCYYPTACEPRTLRQNGIESGEPCEPDGRDNSAGQYNLTNHRLMNGRYLMIALVDAGRTKAEIVERIPVACPKVRAGVEVQWRNGRWEKLLKSKGWVPA